MIYAGICTSALLCFLVLCLSGFVYHKLVYLGALIDTVYIVLFIKHWLPTYSHYGKFAMFISVLAGLLYFTIFIKDWCEVLMNYFERRNLVYKMRLAVGRR